MSADTIGRSNRYRKIGQSDLSPTSASDPLVMVQLTVHHLNQLPSPELHIQNLTSDQWWAAILENVSIKATPTHSLPRKRSNKAIQFFRTKIFSLDEAIKKPQNNFLRTDKAIKLSLIQRILRWSDTNFDFNIYFSQWSDTNFDQKFFCAMKRHILSKFVR